jgi:hypothetical protein
VNARFARVPLALGGLALTLCTSCLGPDEETFEGSPAAGSDRVPVVDDVGEFDPSEAVDDDDGSIVLDKARDPTDGAAFAETDAEGAPKTDAAENERKDGGEVGSKEEPVADDAEAAARKAERSREVERVEENAGDEDEAKAAVAENPPPEPVVESKPLRSKAVDYALETLIVALAAASLSAAIVLARSHPRMVTVASIALGAVAWFVLKQLG